MKNILVKSVAVNWFISDYGDEGYEVYKVGEKRIVEIIYYEPPGNAGKHYCDVRFENGDTTRFFNLHSVTFY